MELDGLAFHTRGEQVRADHRRDADLHLAGWISHRLVWEDLNPFEADATAERLRVVLDVRYPR